MNGGSGHDGVQGCVMAQTIFQFLADSRLRPFHARVRQSGMHHAHTYCLGAVLTSSFALRRRVSPNSSGVHQEVVVLLVTAVGRPHPPPRTRPTGRRPHVTADQTAPAQSISAPFVLQVLGTKT